MITLPASTAPGQVSAPTLARITASQEGDVPTARIGHAAVTLTKCPSSSPPPSPSRFSSIFLFGGEAPTPSTSGSTDEGSIPLLYPKLGDVYEGTPKSPSGATMVWRLLSPPGMMQTPRDEPADAGGGRGGNGGNATTIDSDADVDVPPPMAFHASCAALVRCSNNGGGGDYSGDGSSAAEEALLVHGGMDQSSELLTDLWAFFPSRLFKVASEETGGGGVRGEGTSRIVGNSGGDWATGWEKLTPQGEG